MTGICKWLSSIFDYTPKEIDFGEPERKKEAEKKYPPFGTYRIIPHEENHFLVQYFGSSLYGGVPNWCTVSEYKDTRHVWRVFANEKAAEKYIFDEMERERVRMAEVARHKQAVEDHKKMYPPREIPPFKFTHRE